MATYPDSKGLYLCELLATDKYRATNKFHANATWHHYRASSPCESDPCKNGADCVPDYEMNSYRCRCKQGFCGTHCEDCEGEKIKAAVILSCAIPKLQVLPMMHAMEKSALYRNPTGDFSVGEFQRNPFHYLWMKKIASSMVTDQLDCTFLCVGEPKCYSFNMAAYPDSKGLYLCELLATDKYRATNKFHANATFHHYSPSSPCESDPCKNGADCVPDYEMNSYRCHCKLGFCGTHCEGGENKSCSDIKCTIPKLQVVLTSSTLMEMESPCESDPCKNGADCVPDYEMNTYRCHCKLGFCGTRCDQRGVSSLF
ncbi:hypothetical protein OS493_024419 [Desmophyllum pertusum]|uniref:EGF-like domain-containing protein n=1 Tax=Desmophyllum pertusum TaxID=174260 RepID=A0A9W9YM19_9CNID|nr:hypothetical protein OS493_024419 [Desmophyllum pertusum]